MIDAIQTRFDDWIKWKFKPLPEIIKFLLKHERKHICLENLCHEIKMIEIRKGRPLEAKGLSEIVDTTARLFVSNALEKRRQSLMSPLAQRKLHEDSMD